MQTGLLNLQRVKKLVELPVEKLVYIVKLLTFPVMKISVNLLGCNEKVNHLPEGKLKIHLLNMA